MILLVDIYKNMSSPTWETHIPSDICSPAQEYLSLLICIPLPGKHVSLVICVPPPGKHISLVKCVPPPGKNISLVKCVPPPGNTWFSQFVE